MAANISHLSAGRQWLASQLASAGPVRDPVPKNKVDSDRGRCSTLNLVSTHGYAHLHVNMFFLQPQYELECSLGAEHVPSMHEVGLILSTGEKNQNKNKVYPQIKNE